MTAALHTELWTSWASVLRSYAAVHGINAPRHAVVEVSAQAITLRVGGQWLRFTATTMQRNDQQPMAFSLTEEGGVTLDSRAPEEMDLAAERLTREMLHNG